jgi:hypothetical protein
VRPTGAEGEERLVQLEVHAEQVGARRHEREEPLQAVALGDEHVGAERHGGQGGEEQVRGPDPAGEEHQHEERAHERGGPEVRLEEEQRRHRPRDQRMRDDAEGEGADLLALPDDRRRQVEDERELRDLGRLEADDPQVDPAARAPADDADARDEHEDQRHQRADQQRIREALVDVRRHPRRRHAGDQPEHDRRAVLAHELERVAEALLAVEVLTLKTITTPMLTSAATASSSQGSAARPTSTFGRCPASGPRNIGRAARASARAGLRVPRDGRHGSASTAARNARPRAA